VTSSQAAAWLYSRHQHQPGDHIVIEIVPYQPSWPLEFAEIGSRLRVALGDRALAIHHIGSTSVPGLDAKDVIDVQMTVLSLNDEALQSALDTAGFVCREDIARDHSPPGGMVPAGELEKRYAKTAEPARAAHVHIRVAGCWNQRYALLCRDYLRSHKDAANAYAEIKRQLARYFPNDTIAYYDIKDPVFDVLMAGAEDWARCTTWQPGPTDA
jgi:GrpB-like predicted nucleotidyltransferase (UPF0157 family)